MQAQPKITPADIQSTFLRAERSPLSDEKAASVAGWINDYGVIHACRAANNHGDYQSASAILTYEHALMEAASPRLRAERMRKDAADLEAAIEYHLRSEAEFAGKAEFQRQRGQSSLADEFEGTARAARSLIARKSAEVEALNARASELERRAYEADALFGVVAA